MAHGQDLVWVAGKPICQSSVLTDVTAKRPKTKAKPNPVVPSGQQNRSKSQSNVTADDTLVSEHIDRNLTFSNLCQEDKDKIGALIRKVVSLKVEHTQEAEKAKLQQQKFDEQLRSLQQRNQQIQHQTNELKRHFSSSLALLKVYKEKIHHLGSEKAERDKTISELTKELGNAKQELENLRQAHTSADSLPQAPPTTKPSEQAPKACEMPSKDKDQPENAVRMNESIVERLAQENQRLQRLLDIQNSRKILKPSVESDSYEPVLIRNQEPIKKQECNQAICNHCSENKVPVKSDDPPKEPFTHPDEGQQTQYTIEASNESDDDQALIKELNSHRLHVETLLFMDNDASLLKALDGIGICEQDPILLSCMDHPSSDSDEDHKLQVLTKDLNRRRPFRNSSAQIEQ